jgi:hypothetical protein
LALWLAQAASSHPSTGLRRPVSLGTFYGDGLPGQENQALWFGAHTL